MAVRESRYRRRVLGAMNGTQPENLFQVGQLRVTALALQSLAEAGIPFLSLLVRHARGDQGLAEGGVMDGYPVVSVYQLATGSKIWIVTDRERKHTTIAVESEI